MITPNLLLSALLALAPAAAAQEEKPGAKPADAAATKVEKTLMPQAMCPVSGEALENKDNFVDYQGHRIYSCCEKCVAKIAAFPDFFIYKMYGEGFAPENIQTTCPVSGKTLADRDNFVPVGSMKIYTCCPKCVKKIQTDPARAMDTLHGRKPQETCPIEGNKLEGADGFEFQGAFIKTCCAECPAKFQAEPEKFLKAMADRKEFVEQKSPVCTVHPGEKIKERTFFTTAGPLRYYFANKECMSQFMRDPAKHVPALRGIVPGAKKNKEGQPTEKPKEPAGTAGI
jgi:YHS domain-containing protein